MNKTSLGYLATVLSAAGFASFSLFEKLILEEGVNVWAYTILTSVGALAILLLVLQRKAQPWFPEFSHEWTGYLLFTLCETVSTIAFVAALVELSISLVTILIFTYPAFVTLGNWLFYHHRPSGAHLGAIALTLLGVLFTVNIRDALQGNANLWGIGLALLTACAHGLYIVLRPHLAGNLGATAATLLTRVVLLVTVLLLFPSSLFAIPHISPHGWMLTGLSTVLAGVPPYLFLNWGIDLLGSNRTALLSVVELPIALAAGRLFAGEAIRPMQWLGAVLIMAGVCISHLSQKHSQKADDGPSRKVPAWVNPFAAEAERARTVPAWVNPVDHEQND